LELTIGLANSGSLPAKIVRPTGWTRWRSATSRLFWASSQLVLAIYSGGTMLYWAVMFLIIALVAAFLGFGGVATVAAGIAKILFYIFLIIFLVTLILGVGRRGSRV
jgi:uncharacterized membrane protein YtjA (UPF0391 family)